MPDCESSILHVVGLATGYGKKPVLEDVSLDVPKGEIVALIGHNGAGKSTLLKAVFGLLPVWRGRVSYDSRSLDGAKPHRLLQLGMAYVPQGNRVFADLGVRENLEITGWNIPKSTNLRERIKRALDFFPALGPRLGQKARTLSGGEKQMLALASALISSPRLLLLDEPSLGLAPRIAAEALGRIQQINREGGVSVLIVEQKVREVLRIAHRAYILRNGMVSYSGPVESLDDTRLRQTYL